MPIHLFLQRIKLLTVLTFCIHGSALGQNQYTNDNRFINMSDKECAQLASDLAWNLKDSYPDSSLYFAELALALAKKTDQQQLVAYSLSDIGNYYKRKENYQEALSYYQQSLKIRLTEKNTRDIASAFNHIGLLYKQQEKYDSAAYYFSKGIEIESNTDKIDLKLKLFDGYAMTLYYLGEYDKALFYLDSSFVMAEEVGDSSILARTMQNKGIINQYLGYGMIAMQYYQEAEAYYLALNNTEGTIDVLINQSSLLIADEKYELSEKMLQKAEQLSLNKGFEANLFAIYMNWAACYPDHLLSARHYYQKAYDNAQNFEKERAQLESGIALANIDLRLTQLTAVDTLMKQLDALEYLVKSPTERFNYFKLKSDFFAHKGNHQLALSYAQNALSLQDSIHFEMNNLKDLSAVLEKERNEKKLALEALKTSRAEQETVELKASRDRILLWAVLVLFLVSLLLFLTKRKQQKIQHEKHLQEERFKTKLQQKNYEADLLFWEESLRLETEIREKIGRDLHDELGSTLAVIQMTLEGILQKGQREGFFLSTLRDVVKLVDNSCKKMRTISHELIEYDQTPKGLSVTLENHCKSISESGKLLLDYTLVGKPYPIPNRYKKNIHATITLLIDNIIKHASAETAGLQFFYHSDSINIELVDNGKGFSPTDKSKDGVGLKNAKARMGEINGKLEIDSQPGQGTFISITIPIDYE